MSGKQTRKFKGIRRRFGRSSHCWTSWFREGLLEDERGPALLRRVVRNKDGR